MQNNNKNNMRLSGDSYVHTVESMPVQYIQSMHMADETHPFFLYFFFDYYFFLW